MKTLYSHSVPKYTQKQKKLYEKKYIKKISIKCLEIFTISWFYDPQKLPSHKRLTHKTTNINRVKKKKITTILMTKKKCIRKTNNQ